MEEALRQKIQELCERILKLENALLDIATSPATPRDTVDQIMDTLKAPEQESKP